MQSKTRIVFDLFVSRNGADHLTLAQLPNALQAFGFPVPDSAVALVQLKSKYSLQDETVNLDALDSNVK